MISVIVIIYNEEDYIFRCIDSILQQTYTDLQVLLIDDGSTDRSGKICDEYVTKDNRCRVIHQENKGIAGARNTGLQHAIGEYIMFIDGDDYIHPRFCEILIHALIESGCPLAIADAKKVPDNIKEITSINESLCHSISLSQNELMYSCFMQPANLLTNVMVWGKLYKRSVLEGELFRDIIGEDIEYNSRILQRVQYGVFVDIVLYYWVRRKASIGNQPFSRRNIDELEAWVRCLSNFPDTAIVYRGYVLQRLYKNMLNIRYIVPKELKSYTVEVINRIVLETIAEFKKNKQIGFIVKNTILLMYRLPKLYAMFIWVVEMRAHIVKLCK